MRASKNVTRKNRNRSVSGSLRVGLLLLLVSAALPTTARAQYRLQGRVDVVSYPNIIVYNGKVVTMDDTGINNNIGTVVQAMAVRDGYIVGLGTTDELLRQAGPNTLKIDLKGKTVMPGFIDTHVHIDLQSASAYFRENPKAFDEIARQFSAAGKTLEELRKSIELILTEQLKGVPPNTWIRISLPQQDNLGNEFLMKKIVTRKDLDKWAPNHPVMLQAQIFMTNSKGFELIPQMIGTYTNLAVPDADGLGNMRYYNSTMYTNFYFHSTDRVKVLAEAFRKGLERAAANGITTHGSSLEGLRSWDAFKYLSMQGPMPIRSGFSLRTGFFDNMNTPDFVRRLGDLDGLGTNYMWVLGLTYGSNDANFPNICSTMEAPMEIREMGVCKATYDKNGESYLEGMYWAVRNRHRIMMGHTAGDKALDYVLDRVEKAIEDDPGITLEYVRSKHYTTDHCTFYPRPAQIPRLAKLGFILSCGSGLDGRARILAKYFNMTYSNWIAPVRSLLDAGVKVSFEGEGNPGGSHLAGGIQLMTRTTSDGTKVAPQEAVTRNEFAKMVTSWGAEFMGKPNDLGTLELGKWADFVILSKDYFTVPLDEINTTRPLMTVVGGKMSFLRKEYAQELGLQPIGPQVDYDAPRTRDGGGAD